MNEEFKKELISTIKSKKDLEVFLEVILLSLGERTTRQLLERTKRHINGKKCTLDFDDKSTFLP